MNFEEKNNHDDASLPSLPNHPMRDIGCQLSSSLTSPVVIKEAKKLSPPYFGPTKLSWSSFAMKFHASLIECDLAYL
jgi:hypothetical protein